MPTLLLASFFTFLSFLLLAHNESSIRVRRADIIVRE